MNARPRRVGMPPARRGASRARDAGRTPHKASHKAPPSSHPYYGARTGYHRVEARHPDGGFLQSIRVKPQAPPPVQQAPAGRGRPVPDAGLAVGRTGCAGFDLNTPHNPPGPTCGLHETSIRIAIRIGVGGRGHFPNALPRTTPFCAPRHARVTPTPVARRTRALSATPLHHAHTMPLPPEVTP